MTYNSYELEGEEQPLPQVVEGRVIKRRKKQTRVRVRLKLDSRPAKYFINRNIRGMTKRKAALAAGYSPNNNAVQIERSQQIEQIKQHYKDSLLDKMTLDALAEEHIKNIMQDADRGAKNTAIKMALEKIEPEEKKVEEDDRITVILKG